MSICSEDTGSLLANDDNSISDDASKSKTMTDSESDSKSNRDQLTKRETANVFRLRLLVILVLLLTSIAVSLVIYFITEGGETDEFESQYDAAAQKVLNSFDNIIHEMGAISGLAIAATAYSVDRPESRWPFQTLSSFAARAGNAKELSRVLFLAVMPEVETEDRDAWEEYVNTDANSWIDDGLEQQEELGLNGFEDPRKNERLTNRTVDPIHHWTPDFLGDTIDEDPGPYLCIWQTSPVIKTNIINENYYKRYGLGDEAKIVMGSGRAYLGGLMVDQPGDTYNMSPGTSFFSLLISISEGKATKYVGEPMANLYLPLFDSFDTATRKTVAVLHAIIQWKLYFRSILPSNVNGLVAVLETCNGQFSYELNGGGNEDTEVFPLGSGDFHDERFDKWERKTIMDQKIISDGTVGGVEVDDGACKYLLKVYPSQRFKEDFVSSTPRKITCAIAAVFVFCILMFLFYDRLVERRQKVLLITATQSNAIVSSLFPKQVRDRLMQANKAETADQGLGTKTRLKGFLDGSSDEQEANSAPIADLFPNASVMFADIAGFTAWSSTRDPAQVFILLQSVYQAFDKLAKRRKVFKVETIGDSYMAATGLPEPMPEKHAVTLVRFGLECINAMRNIVEGLEESLGPGTAALEIRVGIHSGQVTAGVLRGDRARFQLFGDTVNTASRMESTGVAGKVQVSAATAHALQEAGKADWCHHREDKIMAKGKGVLNTFWAFPPASGSKGSGSSVSDPTRDVGALDLSSPIQKEGETPPKRKQITDGRARLINWMTDLLLDDIKKIVNVRQQTSCSKPGANPVNFKHAQCSKPISEITDCIVMPKFDAEKSACMGNCKEVKIDDVVIKELRDFVAIIASMYRSNPFHNFEHACHVTMSVKKLLKRVVAPEIESAENGDDRMAKLFEYTHGINSDPLTLLAMTYSALIHDVDHRGVSNMQLAKELPELDKHYDSKSLAEQNSLDVAWNVLMQQEFENLRSLLFASQDEFMRFRQLVVNVVLATDIFDKELNGLRKQRWQQAFGQPGDLEISGKEEPAKKNADLRATIVIEHIIQASDVSHTMQHWHVYQKWNKCLFEELHKGWKAGRMGKNPAEFWYQGELGFFDNYIIPLAKKLKDCGVFGVSSDEYLNYALQNRQEWEQRGKEVVRELVAKLEKEDSSTTHDENTRVKGSSKTKETLEQGGASGQIMDVSSVSC